MPQERSVGAYTHTLVAALLVVMATYPACLAADGETAPSVTGKKLIKWGHDVPSTDLVRENIRRMESTGFDGIAIRFYADVPNAEGDITKTEMDNNWINARPLDKAHLSRAIGNLKATEFKRFTDNFIFMNGNAGGGPAFWFADEHAAQFKRNMCLAAQVCQETGLAGFLIDMEGYGTWTQMTSTYPLDTLKLTIDQARARVRAVTADAARAVSEICPEITILIIYTGYTDRDQNPQNRHRLASGFSDGWLEGLGPKARVFDMREQAYGCKTYADFREIAAPVAAEARNSQLPDLHRERLELGFGVWLDNRGRPAELGGWFQDSQKNHFTPAELSDALHYALAASDGYVWVYSERAFSWPGAQNCKSWDEANVPQAYFDAIADAKRPRPLAREPDARGADTESLPPAAATLADWDKMFGKASPVQVWHQGYGVEEYNKDLTDPAEQAKYKFVMNISDGWEIWLDPANRGLDSRTAVFRGKQEEYPDAPLPAWAPVRVGEFWERQGHRYNGSAWYRVSFDVPERLKGEELWLVFGAVADFCRIFINERGNLYWRPSNAPLPVEQQAGPRMNITEFVEFGKANEMLVWVNNIRGPGGIWKPVKLAVKRAGPPE